MNRFLFLFAILSTAPVFAETQPRCGTDAFGNTVCMDKDGVLTNAPKKQSGGASDGNAASAAAQGETVGEDGKGGKRCGTDPFGNFVCLNSR